jgi:hypothetical protein
MRFLYSSFDHAVIEDDQAGYVLVKIIRNTHPASCYSHFVKSWSEHCDGYFFQEIDEFVVMEAINPSSVWGDICEMETLRHRREREIKTTDWLGPYWEQHPDWKGFKGFAT